jgi:hypothetical protein
LLLQRQQVVDVFFLGTPQGGERRYRREQVDRLMAGATNRGK